MAANLQQPYITLAEFAEDYDIVKDIDVLLYYAQHNKLLSRFSALIVKNADRFKYWLQHHSVIISNNKLKYDTIDNAYIITLALIMLESQTEPTRFPIVPFAQKIYKPTGTLFAFMKQLSYNRNVFNYYNNLRNVILAKNAPTSKRQADYYKAHYIYEMSPGLLLFNGEKNMVSTHRRRLIYNYLLDQSISLDTIIIPEMMSVSMALIISNIDEFISPALWQKIITDINTGKWQNFTSYFLYISYQYSLSDTEIWYWPRNLDIYHGWENIRDYAAVNAFMRLHFTIRRINSAHKYSYVTENTLSGSEEIRAANEGKISTTSLRPFLMQMIARYGINIDSNTLSMLEKYFNATIKIPQYYDQHITLPIMYSDYIDDILRALLVKNCINYQLTYALSRDQMLGVLYTGIYDMLSTENNLLYNYHYRHIIAPQFSKFIYYTELLNRHMTNLPQLSHILQDQAYINGIVHINPDINDKQIIIKFVTIRHILKDLRTYLRPLDNQELMASLTTVGNDLNKLTLIPGLKVGENLSYADLILTNLDLAHKYGIKNIYTRRQLLIIINMINVKPLENVETLDPNVRVVPSRQRIYYRREEYIIGDGKLWDITNNQEIHLSEDQAISLRPIHGKLGRMSIRSLMDAANGWNSTDPPSRERFKTLTGYDVELR